MTVAQAYENFKQRFRLLAKKNRRLVVNTLSNIFTMRLIGNKTHGDLAEIGISEFINQFMYDFNSTHVGKDLFRAKKHEEDILILNEITREEFPVSLKAYGVGPLQLSTDSKQQMFQLLKHQGTELTGRAKIKKVLTAPEFSEFQQINVMPLIYDEKSKRCNIMVFDYGGVIKSTEKIIYVGKNRQFDFNTGKIVTGKGRQHPIYMFIDRHGRYVCEVRYGGASANALQRGLWTHTQKAADYFYSLTDGWLDYSHNKALVKLFHLALNSSQQSHLSVNKILQKDIDRLKKGGRDA